jgi:hypothetical protein
MDEGEVMRRANHEIMMGLAGLLLMTAVVLAAIWFGGERLFVRPIRTLTRIAQPAGTRVRETATPRAAVPPSFRNLVARDPDFTARFGGEEFAVLLQGASLEAAVAAADRLRSAVEDLRIAHETSPKGFVTISIGVASVVPSKGDTAQRLVETADAGLYEAKRRGRNMVVAHTTRALAQAS